MAWNLSEQARIDEESERRARAIVQHQRVLEESAHILRLAEKARRRTAAAADRVYAIADRYPSDVRSRQYLGQAS